MVLIKPVQGKYYVKWLRRDFIDSVAALQCYSSHRSLPKSKFIELMGNEPYSDGFVVTGIDNHPVGFILYRHHPEDKASHFIDLVIHPEHRRKKLGSLLMRWMKKRVPEDFRFVLAPVSDCNTGAHHFLKRHEFHCYGIYKKFFDENDAYLFIYSEDKQEIQKACARE